MGVHGVEVRQGEHRLRSSQVLRDLTVACIREAPELLDPAERVLGASPRRRSSTASCVKTSSPSSNAPGPPARPSPASSSGRSGPISKAACSLMAFCASTVTPAATIGSSRSRDRGRRRSLRVASVRPAVSEESHSEASLPPHLPSRRSRPARSARPPVGTHAFVSASVSLYVEHAAHERGAACFLRVVFAD